MRKKLLAFVVLVLLVGLMSGCLLMPKPKDPDPDPEGPVVLFEDTFDYADQASLQAKWIPWEGKKPLKSGVSPVEGEEDVKTAVVANSEDACGIYILDSSLTDCILEIEFYDPYVDGDMDNNKPFVQGGIYVPDQKKVLFAGVNSTGWGINLTHYTLQQAQNCYVWRDWVDPYGEPNWRVSEVARTKGWHTARFKVTSAGTSVYIDDNLIYSVEKIQSISGIFIGSLWTNGKIDAHFRAIRIIELEE